ncbi:S41 family peptidase [Candidatus Latescibacterota bacterium]
MDSRKQRKILILNLAIAVLIISAIMFVIEATGAAGLTYKSTGDGIDTIGRVYTHVLRDYVKPVDPNELAKNAAEGILKNLDPYSTFLPPKDITNLFEDTKGEFGGLGIEIASPDEYPRVMSTPISGSPAESVGLRAGDIIVKINNESTRGMNINEVVSRLRGKVGTKVTIQVKRGNREDLIPFTITRAKIILKNIPFSGEIEKDIGYIKLNHFNQEASDEMSYTLNNLTKNENLKGVILDLRSNPGGLLVAAQAIASKFLPRESLIVFTLGREPKSRINLNARNKPLLINTPLVVLINRFSASASEIVAGAIQDWDRGVLIGETTFGKGSVQTVFEDLPNAAGFKLTTAHYYTPSGRCIHNEHNLDMDYVEMQMGYEDSDNNYAEKDSLKTRDKFYTKNKDRVVYGGGGVTPDIIVREKKLGNIVVQLLSQNVFFDFAVEYSQKISELSEDFTITDEMVNEYKSFINNEKVFSYTIPGKSSLDNFRKTVEREKINGDIVGMIDNLEETLKAKQDEDFEANREDIKRYLKRDIASVKFGAAARTTASKEWDIQLKKALEILEDQTKYDAILAQGAETGVVAQ